MPLTLFLQLLVSTRYYNSSGEKGPYKTVPALELLCISLQGLFLILQMWLNYEDLIHRKELPENKAYWRIYCRHCFAPSVYQKLSKLPCTSCSKWQLSRWRDLILNADWRPWKMHILRGRSTWKVPLIQVTLG